MLFGGQSVFGTCNFKDDHVNVFWGIGFEVSFVGAFPRFGLLVEFLLFVILIRF